MHHHDEWLDEQPAVITVREVVYDPLEAPTLAERTILTRYPRRRRFSPYVWIVALLLGVLLLGSGIVVGAYLLMPSEEVYIIVENGDDQSIDNASLSPIFTPEVQYWSTDIMKWAEEYNLDPNLIATVIQIESCGNPSVASNSGAQGLFQVMPFHFANGEIMLDVETNAKRGLTYLSEGLKKSDGHAGLALAGYNGGHGVIDMGYGQWPNETQRYFYWGAAIYNDASQGLTSSERLTEWLAAGGSRLCTQASIAQSS